jgi:hypothetical protein
MEKKGKILHPPYLKYSEKASSPSVSSLKIISAINCRGSQIPDLILISEKLTPSTRLLSFENPFIIKI